MVSYEYIRVMQHYQRTTISLPKGLSERAKRAGVNISGTAAKAILVEILKAEYETGVTAAKQVPPVAASC